MIKELILSADLQETRVALLEDGLLAELFIERSENPPLLGNIYLGTVGNVLPGMQSAFIDIGLDRDAFLYVSDLPGGWGRSSAPPAGETPPPIESILKTGQQLRVQVIKEPLGGKGPRVTAGISLPGRSLVYLPEGAGRMISRRVEPEDARERLKQKAEAITGEGGFIMRTAGVGTSAATLQEEADGLRRTWEGILRLGAAASAPACLHREATLPVRILRDLLTEDIARVVVDDEETLERCRAYVRSSAPHLAPRLEGHWRKEPLFERLGIEKEILRALRRRVWLKSGGYLVIQSTEALVAIDVNTGKFTGGTRFEETALQTNLEAVSEIVRQIRLRDLGGILVIDFIDMPDREHRRRLAEALELSLKSDRAHSRVLQVSEFGLVEITRQRLRQSLESVMCRACPECGGSGRRKNSTTLRLEIMRELRKSLDLAPENALRLRVHPSLAASLRTHWEALLADLGNLQPGALRLEEEAHLPVESYEILSG